MFNPHYEVAVCHNTEDALEDTVVEINQFIYEDDTLLKVVNSNRNCDYCMDAEYLYFFNSDGQCEQVKVNGNTIRQLKYRTLPQANEIEHVNGSTIKLSFNYRLDTTQDYANVLEISLKELKANNLTIQDVYVSPSDLKSFIIVLNRDLEVGDEFEIFSTSDIVFADGRTGSVSIVGAQMESLNVAVPVNKISVVKKNGNIVVVSAIGLSALRLIDLQGHVLWSTTQNCISGSVEIDASSFASGVYLVQAKDCNGNAKNEKVVIY